MALRCQSSHMIEGWCKMFYDQVKEPWVSRGVGPYLKIWFTRQVDDLCFKKLLSTFMSLASSIFRQWKASSSSSIQDYCITLTTRNSTQINTSRQCMLKLARISTDWHVSNVFMVHTESSIFVSDVLALYAHWLVPTLKVIMLYIWLPKTEFMPICFCLNFFICGCLLLTYICIW